MSTFYQIRYFEHHRVNEDRLYHLEEDASLACESLVSGILVSVQYSFPRCTTADPPTDPAKHVTASFSHPSVLVLRYARPSVRALSKPYHLTRMLLLVLQLQDEGAPTSSWSVARAWKRMIRFYLESSMSGISLSLRRAHSC